MSKTKTIHVRVRYPVKQDELVLRSELDWNADLAAQRVDRDSGTFHFRLEADKPYLYFKPMLVHGSERRWSVGPNYLAVARAGDGTEVFPHFVGDEHCSVCSRTQVTSDIMGSVYSIRVFLPPGYGENILAHYPVLYMQDGHNLFLAHTSAFGQHWQIRETLGVLDEMNVIRRAVVVGIRPNDRMVEYTRPGYQSYGRFLVEELKPLIDQTYRTLPGREDTGVMGSSLGGVVSFYLGWQYPEVFGMAACLSSTFGWRDDLLERVVSEDKRSVRFYLDSGFPSDNYEATRAMRAQLLDRSYEEGVDLQYLAFPRAKHDEKAWATRCHIPFQYFFGRSGEAAD